MTLVDDCNSNPREQAVSFSRPLLMAFSDRLRTESCNDTCRCYITHATLYDNGRHVWMRDNSKLRWKLASVIEDDDNLESSKVAGIGRSDID
jgi:hypothetical protein